MNDRHGEAAAVALEHLTWCRSQGLAAWRILQDIGWTEPVRTGDELLSAIAVTWLGLDMVRPA